MSEVYLVGTKKWQARTIATCQAGKWHHILFPFLVASGGVTKIGVNAAGIITSFGATPHKDLRFCNIALSLPVAARDCVYRWEDHRDGIRDLDDGHDIRKRLVCHSTCFRAPQHLIIYSIRAGNNMIGENDADVITNVQAKAIEVNAFKRGFEEAVDELMLTLEKFSPRRDAIALELAQTIAAPPPAQLFEAIAAKRVSGVT